ncbi:MAG: peptidylprolyl isomerase [Endomicrobium sp.]|jgi:parvulin-like peptidyl-prolyl isomerase|nr:peptidylprolyl isomerase [Endomicrobium sp.]
MKKFFSVLVIVFFMAGSGNIFAAPKKVDQTFAIVNGKPIFESEFNKIFNDFRYAMFASEQLSEQKINELKNYVLEGQIEDILLKSEAKKQRILVSRKEVLEYIKDMKKNYAVDEELGKQNLPPKDLEKKVSELLRIMKLLNKALSADVKEITEAETKSFYDKVIIKIESGNMGLSPDNDGVVASVAAELKKMFSENVRIKQIFIKNPKSVADAEVKKVQTKVETVKKELQIKSFAEIARKYSEDIISRSQSGDFGVVTKGDLPLVLEKAIFSMKVGDYTKEPIKTDIGYYFIKVEEKLPNRKIVFDNKVKDYINSRLLQFNSAQAYTHYINTLKAKSNIKINKIW